ncbi:MAG: DUF5916 domain-containing protein [Gemmatimonadaceae bacterium]
MSGIVRVASLGAAAAFAALSLLARSGHAQADTIRVAAPGRSTVHQAAPSIRAARKLGTVRVDGRLDDEAWRSAIPFTDFRQYDPQEGAAATERTEARVLIAEDALYVGIRLFDSEPAKIQSELTRRDDSVEGDIVEVYIDSYHDHLTGAVFRLSPAGARRDASMSAGGGQDNSWDPIWEGSAAIDSAGWSAEFRIPLSQLRYDPNNAEHVWGIQLARRVARKGELQYFAFTPKSEQQGVNRYGHLTGLGRLPAPGRVEFVPYVLAKNANPTVESNDPFRRRNEVAPGIGLDVKYGITSNLTVDATFNPDFGQVEVDPAVVNLSAFETFFPERRPFFIEGASIFNFGEMRTQNASNGYSFLHTRRIGREPQRFLFDPNFSFVDAPHETTIAGAAKLTGRTPGGWSIGVLDAYTLREEARFRTPTALDTTATVEPASNYFTGRLKRDLRGGNTTIGAAINTVHRQLDDPTLEPLFRSAAYVGGIDWTHAWQNRRWAFDGAVVVTHNVGSAEAIDELQTSPARYFQRPDRKSYRRDPTRTSLTGYLTEMTFAKLSGEHWRGSLTYQEYNPGFEINESGFLNSTDMRSFAPIISYREQKPGKYLRNWEQYLFWNPSWTFDGDLTFNGVGAITFFETANFWNYFLRFDWRPPVVDPGLTRGGPIGGLRTGGGGLIEVNSDRRKRHNYGAFVNYSFNTAGGRGLTIGPRATIRPSTAIRVQLQPQYSRTHALAQYVTTAPDPFQTETYGSRYVFATLNQDQLSMTTRLDWTFTPKVSLQLFAQPLLAAGDFYDYKEFMRPRAFAFAVYGRDQGTISRDAGGVYTVDPDGLLGPANTFNFSDRDFNGRFLRGNAVLRWEYRPGSALFLVWQQSRSGSGPPGDFELGRDLDELWGTPPVNVFVLKATWYVGR